MVKWPAIIQFSDDAELVYIKDQSEWKNDPDIKGFNYDETDCLIDSTGQVYKFYIKDNGDVQLFNGESNKTLEQVLGLVKAHASQSGSCCVAKLYAPSIKDAFEIIKSINDN